MSETEEGQEDFIVTFKLTPDKRELWQKMGYESLVKYNESLVIIYGDKFYDYLGNDITDSDRVKQMKEKNV